MAQLLPAGMNPGAHPQQSAYPGGPPTSLYPGGSPYPNQAQSPYPGQQQPFGTSPRPGYQPQFGAPATPQQLEMFMQSLRATIAEKRLDAFYPPHDVQKVHAIATRAAASVEELCQTWRLPREIGADVAKIGLYDVVLYIDDSGSMAFEEGGERIKDLELVLQRVSHAAGLLDEDGISVRFMNSTPPPQMLDKIRRTDQIDALMREVKFKGLTPMGTELRRKIIDDIVRRAQSNSLAKPVLVITLTDGTPAGEAREAVFDTIKYANAELSKTRYGPGAIALQFAQLGNDTKAREFLAKLDADPTVGHLIDCTSSEFWVSLGLFLAPPS